MSRTLVIGIGNTLRSDDGAGVLAARKIQERFPEVDVIVAQELLPEVAEVISQSDTVVFIDASVATDHVLVRNIITTGQQESLSHFHSPESVLELSAHLYGKVPGTRVMMELPANNLDLGESVTSNTARAVEECVEIFGGLFSCRRDVARDLSCEVL